MKNTVVIVGYLTAMFTFFVLLIFSAWDIFNALELVFPVENLMPITMLISAAIFNKLLVRKFLSETFITATITSLFHTIIILILVPGWYPSLHWATILGCLISGYYINYRELVVIHFRRT